MTDYSVRRDRWDRPYVTRDGGPLKFDGTKPLNCTPYVRVSTLAGSLDDKAGLVDWAACNAAVGVVRDKALYAGIAHLASAHPRPWYSEAKKPLKELVARAQELGGASSAADMGTAFHGFTEIVDAGGFPEFAPDELVPWLDAYSAAMADWEVVDAEPFLVCDELEVAGSADRVLRHRVTGQTVVADIKTGTDEPRYPLKVTMQVAAYARSVHYDQQSGDRRELGADLNVGLMIHVPIKTETPVCKLYPLDLTTGWRLARLAKQVRELRRMKPLGEWK